MAYLGDFRLGDTFDTKFCTVATTGAPTTLAGSPAVAAYVGNNTTEITAGITLSVDFDSRTGLHNVRVVATGGNGYATASNYQLVLTAGTVGGTSVVGYVVGEFSIEARSALMPTTPARTLDVTLGNKVNGVVLTDTVTTYTGNTPQTGDNYARIGAAGVGLTNLGDTRIANLDATISSRTKPADTQAAVTTVTNLTNAPTAGDFTATMKTSLNASTPASVTGAVGSVTALAANSVNASALATDAVTEIVTAVFARVFSAAYGSYTFDELTKLMAAVLLGKCSGMGTATGTFRNLADSADTLVATIDSNGNRTAVTRTP